MLEKYVVFFILIKSFFKNKGFLGDMKLLVSP